MNEPTVEQLQAQVDALVAELAHLQGENERLRNEKSAALEQGYEEGWKACELYQLV